MQLLETIRIESGKPNNLEYHQERMDRSIKEFYGLSNSIVLEKLVMNSNIPSTGLYKLRISYNNHTSRVELIPYKLPIINSLKVIVCNDIEYNYKFFDRSKIEKLFSGRGGADDIIIVKNGCVTDSSYANLVFYDGNIWVTPTKPLLLGTQCARYIDEKKVSKANIAVDDLGRFEKVRLINAMIRFEDELDISIENIQN